MLLNYLKIAWRNLKRNKTHTIINVLGLAIGIASCLFVAVYVLNELSYDSFFKDSGRIYRIAQTSVTPEKTEADAVTPFPLGAKLKAEYPRLIDNTVRLYNRLEDQHTFYIRGDSANPVKKAFLETHFFFVDSTFFDVFDLPLIHGNPQTALDKPLSLVITKAKAKKFFGDKNPMGRHIYFQSRRMRMTITGIMKPWPANSHINADMLASSNSLNKYFPRPKEFRQDWFQTNTWTYIKLNKGIHPGELSRQFPRFLKKYYSNLHDKNANTTLTLQPIERIHLHSHRFYEIHPNGSIFNVYVFATAALLLLIIACINFMNLATARASRRSREVGMRKTLGASRRQLFWQFIGESFLLTSIAFVISIVLFAALLPVFNSLIGNILVIEPFKNIKLIAGMVGLFVFVGLLAGLYPAIYLSGFLPQQILSGDKGSNRGGSTLRKGLVIFQFAMTAILIIGTVIVFLQLQHMQQKKLGFDKNQIAVMPMKQNLINWEYPAFKKRVEQSPAIRSVTGIQKILGSDKADFWKVAPAGKGGAQGEANETLWVTHDFVKTFGLKIVAGRAFSRKHKADGEKSLLINQQMVKKLGYDNPRDALGALFYYTTIQDVKKPKQVIGVVKDFNYKSIKKAIKPTVILLADSLRSRLGAIYHVAAKIAPGQTQQGLAKLKKVWNDVDILDPFSYTFQDQQIKKTYVYEARTSTVLRVSTFLCIIVACLGLFGLASFTVLQRTKEIGIRKTLGASVSGIVLLLSKEYVKLVLIANVIAWPIIFYIAYRWLQNFAYRITLGWNIITIFAAVAAASLLICLATVAYQSIRAALVNPVDSIRQE